MSKIKMWQPVAHNDLPAALRLALRAANLESKRKWTVCQQLVIETNALDGSAEIARLRQMVDVLQRQLQRR